MCHPALALLPSLSSVTTTTCPSRLSFFKCRWFACMYRYGGRTTTPSTAAWPLNALTKRFIFDCTQFLWPQQSRLRSRKGRFVFSACMSCPVRGSQPGRSEIRRRRRQNLWWQLTFRFEQSAGMCNSVCLSFSMIVCYGRSFNTPYMQASIAQ